MTYQLSKGLGRRLTNEATGDSVFIPPADTKDFDFRYWKLMREYRDAEQTVLALLWEQYGPKEPPRSIVPD